MDENAHPGSGGPFSRSQIDKAPETFSLFLGFRASLSRLHREFIRSKERRQNLWRPGQRMQGFSVIPFTPHECLNLKIGGGSVAEWSACRTRNPAVLGSSPALATCWICARSSRVQILDHACKQPTGCLLPVGVFNPVMLYLNYLFLSIRVEYL